MAGEIHIQGLAEFRRELKAADRDAPKGIRIAGNNAAKIVVTTAKPRVPRLTGRAASTVRAASTQSAGRVSGGNKRAPYYPWLDFGGRVGRNNSVKRPFIKTGRYIWAAFVDEKPAVERELRDQLVGLAQQQGWSVR